MPKSEIILSIYGGVLQFVYASDVDIDIILVDWDVTNPSPEDEGIVQAIHDKHTIRAFVSRPNPVPIHELAGSEIESLINAAEHDAHHAL